MSKVIVMAFYICPDDDVRKTFAIPENEINIETPPVKECPVCHKDMNFVGTEGVTISENPSPIPQSQQF
jgi:hypothetical protein